MSARDSVSNAALEAPAIDPPGVASCHGVVVGELVALAPEGGTPLVMFPGQPGSAALRARTAVDLHGEHVGHGVVLMFEHGDPSLPIVLGILRGDDAGPSAQLVGQVELDGAGERLVVSARRQLVLRCGAASITLTSAGKVLIAGHYVVTCASGMNRIKGGSVQIN